MMVIVGVWKKLCRIFCSSISHSVTHHLCHQSLGWKTPRYRKHSSDVHIKFPLKPLFYFSLGSANPKLNHLPRSCGTMFLSFTHLMRRLMADDKKKRLPSQSASCFLGRQTAKERHRWVFFFLQKGEPSRRCWPRHKKFVKKN